MRPRDLLFAIGGLALLGAAGVVMMGGQEPAPIGDPAPVATRPDLEPQPGEALGTVDAPPPLTPGADGKTALQEARTEGMVRGHITLAPGLAREIDSVIVRIRELGEPTDRRAFVHNARLGIDASDGSPRFAIDGIPFSEHEYRVRLFADPHNGTDQTIRLTPEHPVADVVLGITIGTYVSVLLRDQQRNAVTDQPVLLVPVGEPGGRRLRRSKSDNFGAAPFEHVLRGKYKIVVGDLSAPRNAESFLDVGATSKTQGKTVLVPNGFDLTLLVNGPNNWGVKDAAVEILALDAKVHRQQNGVTDHTGKCVLEHVPAGYYQVNVHSTRHQRWSRNVRIGEDRPPDAVKIRLLAKGR